MRHRLALVLALGLLGASPQGSPQSRTEDPLPATIQFNRDIRPILSENCYKCHGPDPKARKGDLRLDTREGALAEVEKGVFAIVPGKPDQSELCRRVASQDAEEKMPPPKSGKKLSRRDVALLRKWIAEGAPYQGHWSYLPLKRPSPPAVRNAAWVRTPVDAFVLSRLEKEGLAPSPEADPITLLRRLSFDLTGLPPTPKEAEDFQSDRRAQAYSAAVERLLASPHYGERMALFWLDLVRFANSRGYHSDNPRMVDPYRDYVIEAFNENMRFDHFTQEQLAGDLLAEPTLRQRVASCYNKLNQTTEEGGAQAKEYEAKTAADRVRDASNVWLGATMGCCECHDHKFDPYTMRDFYSLAAFFADLKEQPIRDSDRGIPVPSEAEAQELARLDQAVALAKEKLEMQTPELDQAQADWEKAALRPFPWVVLTPESVKSTGKAEAYIEEDGSVILSGPSPAKDTLTLALGKRLRGVTAFRLEALADPTLPGNGPGRAGNGNYVLSEFTVKIGKKAVALRHARADHSQDQFSIAQAIDGKKGSGWAILPQTGKDHSATFETQEPSGAGEEPFQVTLDFQSSHAQHILGRFRVSATTQKDPSAFATIPGSVREILATPPDKRSPEQKKALAAHYRSIAPSLDPHRAKVAELEKKRSDYLGTIPTCLISVSASPRTMRIKPRGNWMDDSGESVVPDTPKFLPPLGLGERRATRLDLARWLVSGENPLVARVFANRLWKLFFGLGLSKSLDDLGAQGEWPVHPELLDWLAAEFRDGGWDVKETLRKIVLSATYRQSSIVRPELRERDPFNRLLARQSRWRLEAEFVRDNALAISGLLVTAVGGRSVRPYQPKGYWAFLNFPAREWQNDTGENVYRRGLYTWWQRTFPHPSLIAFDAPSREECCAERVRSNIPQQALVLLNDPTYVEASRVFGEKILREGGAGPGERLEWAFRRALSRAPRPEEKKLLSELQEKHRAEFKADSKAAQEIISAGQAPVAKDLDPAELASWASVARALLNLHETITRN